MCAKYRAGKNSVELAKEYGCGSVWVLTLLRQRGVTIRTSGEAQRMFTDKVEREICAKYVGGKNTHELGGEYGCSNVTICGVLKRRGIVARSQSEAARKYACNQGYFGEPLDEERTYWIGFLLADGSIMKRGAYKLQVILSVVDRVHILKLRRALSSTSPVVEYPSQPEASRLYIYSNELCTDLMKYGVVPRKTYGHPLPVVPAYLERHLFRGLFDGDGCIGYSRRDRSWAVSLSGTKEMIYYFATWINKRLFIMRRPRKVKGVVCYTVQYGAKEDVFRILNLLYGGANIFLDRKMDIAQRIINAYPAKYIP